MHFEMVRGGKAAMRYYCGQCLNRILGGERQKCSTYSARQMMAWQIHEYGGNEKLTLSPTSRIPPVLNPRDMLVEVHAASVNPIDFRMREGYGKSMINLLRWQFGSLKSGKSEFPLILGRDFSGVVVETGKGVTKYKVGDEVWGALSAHRPGTHAQYTVVSDKEISHKPKNVSHMEAASLPYVAVTAWTALCSVGELDEENAQNQRVFIQGGSGGIGSFAVQLMKSWGAEVTTTCSTDAVDFVTSLGADFVIDYKTDDVYKTLKKIDGFDVMLDTLGGETMDNAMSLLKTWRNSKYVTIMTPFLHDTDRLGVPVGLISSAGKLGCGVLKGLKDGCSFRWAMFVPNAEALKKIAELVDTGEVKPIIEKEFPFEEVPEAFDKVSKRHGRGKTVINVKAAVG